MRGQATVQTPRVLPVSLVTRLDEVAAMHGGKVPLHGRLFAQWMHHAFPRECPYPHEAGTTNPQTPDEWMKESGHESSKASMEEMQQHVDGDGSNTNSGAEGGVSEDVDLPWVKAEELLAIRPPPSQQPQAAGYTRPTLALAGVTVVVVFAAVWYAACADSRNSKDEILDPKKPSAFSLKQVYPCLALCALFVAAVAAKILDVTVFAYALVGGLVVLLAMQHSLPQQGQLKGKTKDC